MTRQPDFALTFVLLLPLLALGAAAVLGRRRSRKPRRLTNAEVKRMYRITAERAGKYQSN